MMSPTARSLALLRSEGYTAQVVEYFNRFSKTRKDLFGCIDIVAVHPELGILGVQATTGAHHAERLKKAKGCNIGPWLHQAGFEVWSWSKKADGKWHCRREALELMDLGGKILPAVIPTKNSEG